MVPGRRRHAGGRTRPTARCLTCSPPCARPILRAPMRRRASGGPSAAETIQPLALCCRRMPDPFLFASHADRTAWNPQARNLRECPMQLTLGMFDTGAGDPCRQGPAAERGPLSRACRTSGLWAVADGMGGHEDGEYASQTIVDALGAIERASVGRRPAGAMRAADRRGERAPARFGRERGGAVVGATIAVLLTSTGTTPASGRATAASTSCATARSRNCRATTPRCRSCSRKGAITPEEAETWPGKNVVTRAIGVFDQPELELDERPARVRRRLRDLQRRSDAARRGRARFYATSRSGASQQACDALIELTLTRGAVDNVTVVDRALRAGWARQDAAGQHGAAGSVGDRDE